MNWYYVLAFAIGATVGLVELLNRFARDLKAVVMSGYGWPYMTINGLVAVLAYRAALDWKFVAGTENKPEFWRVLFVSVLAMAALRTVFAIRIGDKEVGIGLIRIIDTALRRAERSLDKKLANARWETVGPIVSDLTYEATRDYFVLVGEIVLPITADERVMLQADLTRIEAADLDSDVKMQLLAVVLSNTLGDDLFATIANGAKKRFAAAIESDRERREARLRRLANLTAEIDN